MNPAHNWCVAEDEGCFWVCPINDVDDVIVEFETEQECWNYIDKCQEHGIDF